VRLPVTFTAPAKGFASLAVYDAQGVLVRSLLSAQPVDAGSHTALWDATTELGLPVPPGTYTAKGIFFVEPPALKYVLKVGKSGNPPWRTPDGKGDWGGNLGGPSAICANRSIIIMAWSCVEDNQVTGVQQMDGQGNIQLRYYTFYPWDARCAAAMDETEYYLGIENWQQQQLEIAVYQIGQPRGKILTVLPTGRHEEQSENRWRGRWSAWLDGMALTADTLYASIASDNALFVINRRSGNILRTIHLPSPRGLAVVGSRLLVVSDKRIVRLRLDGSLDSVWIDRGLLKAPHALAVDRIGNVYVGDSHGRGLGGEAYEEGSRQVYVFAPDGTLLRKIGKDGGAPDSGRFEAGRLGDINSLCTGPDGQSLWVQDVATGFPRTSRWSLDGKLQHQWFTRKLSHYPDAINPGCPSEAIEVRNGFSDDPGITARRIDLESGTWKPSWHYDCTWADMYQEDIFLSHDHPGNPLKGKRWPVFQYGFGPLVKHGGRTYTINSSGNDDGVVYVLESGQKPRPVAMVSYHRAERKEGKLRSFYDNGPNNWFTWADRNGDGRISADEILFTENPPPLQDTGRIFEGRLDEQLCVHVKRPIRTGKHFRLVDSVLPPKEILPNGAPVYDWSLLRDAVVLQPPDLTGGDGWKTVRDYMLPVPLETADAFYSLVVPENDQKLKLPGIDGDTWWASRNWRTRLVRFDKHSGRPLWAVGRRAPGRAEPGQMYYPAALAGTAGDALFVLDTMGMVWVWHKDGLYIGRLYHDTGLGQMDDQSIYCEIQSASIYHDPRSGKVYSMVADTGTTFHEVLLPKIQPLVGSTVTVTPQAASQAQPWDPDGVAPSARPACEVYFTPQPPKIDGSLDGCWWRLPDGRPRPEMLVMLDGQRLGSVRAMYDRENLYLGYLVRDAAGPLNRGSELPYCPFVSGAYVDFCIAPDWSTTPRDELREGDLRVILARIANGAAGCEDFQQGFWPRKSGGANPQTIASPAATVHFDQIQPVPGLKMAYRVEPKRDNAGLIRYEVEVSLPLAGLGLKDPAGKSIGFDASIGVANAVGDRRERAAHWAGQSEGVVVDRPGSARLLPNTWGTLHFASPGAEGTAPIQHH
jgi:sugar lactone lactonase YvrE